MTTTTETEQATETPAVETKTPATRPKPQPKPRAPYAKVAPGALACLACGQAVEKPVETVQFVAIARDGEDPLQTARRDRALANGHQVKAVLEVTLTKCPSCDERHKLAVGVAERFPELAGRLGSVAPHQLSLALDVLAVAGIDMPVIKSATEALGLIRDLGELGGSIRWSTRYNGVAARDARAGQCTSKPWSHLYDDLLAEVRQAGRRYLAMKVASTRPDVLLAPRKGGGCLLCGIGQVSVPAATVVAAGGVEQARSQTWKVLKFSPAALGGKPSPEQIEDVCCPACARALERAGSIGVGAMVAALKAHLAATGRTRAAGWLNQPELVQGLVAWRFWREAQARKTGRILPPSSEPWSHVNIPVEG